MHGRNVVLGWLIAFFLFCFNTYRSVGQTHEDTVNAQRLKKLTLEELMDIEVVTVSRSPQQLSRTASAIQVITREDILRSGATRLPEALRLASNLIVAQSNSHDWGITARGFNGAPLANNTSANKLLVMIDGRIVYSPLFGGVFWDVQNVLLEDVDHIEVISGPGGTLWDSNAVNGVINIITRNARDTEGLYATVAAGDLMRTHMAVRYGLKLNENLFLRVYGQRFNQEGTATREGSPTDEDDRWNMTQAGFRLDFSPSEKVQFTAQGDFYNGKEDVELGDITDGQNLMVRWNRVVSARAGYSVQLYYDRTWRYLPAADFGEELHTYDLDFQHHFPVGSNHRILWGAGARLMSDIINNSPALSFSPARRDMELLSVFIQDHISLVPDQLTLTVGSKLLHNVYSGFDLQPSGRLAWTPERKHTVWAAASRTVRTPTRWDADEVSPHVITPGGNFKSEKVRTYEMGYRLEPVGNVSISLATYFNQYDDLKSINVNPSAPPPFHFANDQRAESMGFEVSGNYYASSRWRLRGGYTFLRTNFWTTRADVSPLSPDFEAIDPKGQFLFQSILDLPKGFEFDWVGRYVHRLEQTGFTPNVPSYFTFDLRLGWQFEKFTLAVIGQNLAEKYHLEFGPRRIPRTFHARATFRW